MMRRIESRIDPRSADFQRFRAANLDRVAEFQAMQEAARFERPQRDFDRLEHHGKMFVRDRIQKLLDPGTPFLELSSLAANTEYDGDAKSASVVCGIGVVSGREVIVRADDPSIKGGAWYPLTVKKNVRILDIAIENRLPVVHICDSAGGFLPLQSEIFADRDNAGRIFRNQSILSKMGVPQLSLVFGQCTAGGAYIPSLSDYSVILRGNGGIFLGGPPLVKAATGEVVDHDTGRPMDEVDVFWSPVSEVGARERHLPFDETLGRDEQGQLKVTAPIGEIEVSIRAEGYSESAQRAQVRAEPSRFTFLAQRQIELRLEFRSSNLRVTPPLTLRSMVVERLGGVEEPDRAPKRVGYRFDEDVLVLDDAGRYRLTFPELEGYAPVAPQELDVEPGGRVLHVIDLVRE